MEELCDAEWSEVVAPAVEGFESFLGPLLQAPIANGTIGYRRFGNTRSNRPALIMATGFGQTMGSWADGTLRTLAQSQEVIIFDHRGMGQSAVRRSGGCLGFPLRKGRLVSPSSTLCAGLCKRDAIHRWHGPRHHAVCAGDPVWTRCGSDSDCLSLLF